MQIYSSLKSFNLISISWIETPTAMAAIRLYILLIIDNRARRKRQILLDFSHFFLFQLEKEAAPIIPSYAKIK